MSKMQQQQTPQMMNSAPSTPLNLVSTEQIQKVQLSLLYVQRFVTYCPKRVQLTLMHLRPIQNLSKKKEMGFWKMVRPLWEFYLCYFFIFIFFLFLFFSGGFLFFNWRIFGNRKKFISVAKQNEFTFYLHCISLLAK